MTRAFEWNIQSLLHSLISFCHLYDLSPGRSLQISFDLIFLRNSNFFQDYFACLFWPYFTHIWQSINDVFMFYRFHFDLTFIFVTQSPCELCFHFPCVFATCLSALQRSQRQLRTLVITTLPVESPTCYIPNPRASSS